MSIPTKRELLNDRLGQAHLQCDEITTRLNDALQKNYIGKSLYVSIERWPSEYVQERLIERYRESGWTLRFASDQRDGNFIEIS